MKMTRFVMYWTLAGLLIPVVIFIIARYLWDIFDWPYLGVVLWPSSIMLMALETIHQRWWEPIVVVAISVGSNVVLYSTVGGVLWLLWRLLGRLFK
ncbi:hypothetical protein [Candidatus Methylomirabilis sp.]|uniref:Uncharacterized protein n=1 Tax=Candidatus Methylomirabilis tolerans TaxID=3123416 RepID=A0AAJ1EJZ9_9BACT|nr:hypothetical protein [Candidatus Methylomirabilis sp.]